MNKIALITVAVFVTVLFDVPGRVFADDPSLARTSLYAQSAGRTLEDEFRDCAEALSRNSESCVKDRDVSFLLLDARTGALLASHWPNPETAIPLGSLVKPITALAYGETHQFRYPTHVCRGTASGCWLPHGHGTVDLTQAIAHSCNSYFRMLTSEMTEADVSPVAVSLGLQPPAAGSSGAALAGIGGFWQISPLSMSYAYLELILRRNQPGVRQIVAGMAESAAYGTGEEVDRALGSATALVKTGTAPCTHASHAPGDGFAIVLMPATDPQILLMVRVHGVPGAQAAKTVGHMLRRIEE